MSLIALFFFYSFTSSVILVYGIGLEKTFLEGRTHRDSLVHSLWAIAEIVVTVLVSWYAQTLLSFVNDLVILYPVAIVLVSGIVHSLFDLVRMPQSRKNAGEKIFFFGTVFLAVSEGTTVYEAIIAACASLTALYVITGILFALRERSSDVKIPSDWKGTPLILVCMGLLFIVLYSADASWWLSEVFK